MAPLLCPLRQAAITSPAAVAVFVDGQSLTFAELDRRVVMATDAMRDAGLYSGQKLALISETSLDLLTLILAAIRLGVIVCPLSHRFPRRQIGTLLAELDTDRVWCASDMLKPACRGVPPLKLSWQALQEQTPLAPIEPQPEQLCSMILTSGSGGQPKAAVHSLANHWFSARGANERIPLERGDAWLLSLPLFHIGGFAIIFRTLLAQAALVIGDAKQSLAENLVTKPVTHVSLVNAQLYRLLQQSDFHLAATRLKVMLLGGGHIANDLLQRLHNANVSVYLTYGLTEMSSQVTTGEVTQGEGPANAGKVLRYRELKIARGGEILVKGETLFQGYYSHAGLRRELDRTGWFHTGDRGRLVGERLEVLGRLDNLFISGGENIQPEEIERILRTFPEIGEAVVVPAPDPEYGQRPVAFIQRVDTITESELRRRLSQQIARFKIPDRFLEWPADEEQAGFKINRRRLQEYACRFARSI